MKTNHPGKAAGSLVCAMIMAAVVLLFLITRIGVAGDCLLALQLNDPEIRAEYDASIAAGLPHERNLNEVLDQLSWHCLACHDGTVAPAARYRISNGNLYLTKSIETIQGAHPVGMDYVKFSTMQEYAPVETLPPDMVLMNGAVGCVTCHNLLGRNSKYTVVENSTSGLCFSCHRK